MVWEEPDGEPHPSLRILPCNIWSTTELMLMANRSVGVLEMFVLVGEMELFMMKVKKIISLSGHYQT